MASTMQGLALCVLLIMNISAILAGDAVNVLTKSGRLRGVLNPASNVQYFLGIPYAEPPVGDLRFAAPLPKSSWTGVRAAYLHGSSCPQVTSPSEQWTELPEAAKVMSEDCLTLDIYSPVGTNNAAVMIWIHGGGYKTGTSAEYDGSNLATRGVVVVVINYRLGPFGFISSGDDKAPGNYGLLDQRLAMKWVKNNIAAFGGNPSKVTLFGHEVGANSAFHHLLSHPSKNLFSRAILQSSSFPFPTRSSRPRSLAVDLASVVGCQTSNIISCLRDTSVDKIINALGEVQTLHPDDSTLWAPVDDGVFFNIDPSKVTAPNHEIILGMATGDGSWVLDMLQDGHMSQEAWNVFSGLYLEKNGNAGMMQGALDHEYLHHGHESNDVQRLRRAVDLSTDVFYLIPTATFLQDANLLAKSIYFYVFDQPTSDKSYPSWFNEAPHGGSLSYIWTSTDEVLSPEERLFSDAMITYWTNFAKSGSPNAKFSSLASWPEYLHSGKGYLHLKAEDTRVDRHYRASKIHFWLDWLPLLSEESQCVDRDDGMHRRSRRNVEDKNSTDTEGDCEVEIIGGSLNLSVDSVEVVVYVLVGIVAFFGIFTIFLVAAVCAYKSQVRSIIKLKDMERFSLADGPPVAVYENHVVKTEMTDETEMADEAPRMVYDHQANDVDDALGDMDEAVAEAELSMDNPATVDDIEMLPEDANQF